MFYNAESPSFEDSSIMPENNNKGFDSINYGGSDFYDIDAEVSYTDLFNSSGQDQAVVSKVNTNLYYNQYTLTVAYHLLIWKL